MDNKKQTEGTPFFDGVNRIFKREAQRRKTERGALFMDVALFLLAFVFARKHILFGAYPLAVALIATLTSRVWIGLVGAVIGSLSLGSVGIIHAIISIITVFLRILISGGPRKNESGEQARAPLFSEPYVMRVAALAIGSSLGGLYEMILNTFAASSVLFAAFGVLITVAVAFALYGLYTPEITYGDILFGERNVFSASKGAKGELERRLFQASFLVLAFLITLSLSDYAFFGISPAYIFAGGLTLFVAKRFGALRAAACGFVSSVSLGATAVVGFALCGLSSGLLFSLNLGYALVGGAAALGVWCAYAGGISAFLAVIPEYIISSMLLVPYLKGAKKEKEAEVSSSCYRSANDMVSSTYASKRAALTTLAFEDGLLAISSAVRAFAADCVKGTFDDYRNICIALTASLNATPCEEKIDILATKLYKKAPITKAELEKTLGCCVSDDFFSSFVNRVCEYESECSADGALNMLAGEYEFTAGALGALRQTAQDELAADAALTERLSSAFSSLGFADGCVKVFGGRRKYVIAAAEDEGGQEISSERLKGAFESALGLPLGEAEYFKKEKMALVCFRTQPIWTVEYASCSSASAKTMISGDSTAALERDGMFYSLLSDGMGSGEVAEKTSRFAVDFLAATVSAGCPLSALPLTALNSVVKESAHECSATVDVLSLDLLCGEAEFLKCGAAPSYIKRRDSLFRVRSRTAPIGLVKGVDSERIRAEVRCGDYIIMLSDGVDIIPDEAPWLIEMLGEPTDLCAKDYADKILREARARSGVDDDITVCVMKISSAV